MILRKKIQSTRYAVAFAVTIAIFLLGYVVSYEINDIKFNQFTSLEQDIRSQSLSDELVIQLIQKDLCNSVNVTSYSSELTTYGKRLTYLESLYESSSSKLKDLKNVVEQIRETEKMIRTAL